MTKRTLREKLGSIALVVIAAAIFAGSYFRVLDGYELQALDMRFRLRPPIPATDKIAIIEIGDDTIQKLGRFPFDRSYHAVLVKALSAAGAKMVLFDLFFSEPHSSDAEFVDAIAKAGNVYFPVVFELDPDRLRGLPCASGYSAVCLDDIVRSAKGTGHINIIPDIDGKFRRASAFIKDDRGGLVPYFSLFAACEYLGISMKDVSLVQGRSLGLGSGIDIPLDEDSAIIVNYSASWGKSYRHYSFFDIIQSYMSVYTGDEPNIDLSGLKDKICIIGLTALGTVDLHPNPFDPLYPAVGMHAEVFNSILNKNFVRRASRGVNLLILVSLFAMIVAIILKTKPLRGLIYLFATIAILVLSGMLIFNKYGLWIDLIYPILVMGILHLSVTLYKYISEWKKGLLLENELSIAKKIQMSFLPKSVPAVDPLEVSVAMFTARQVGGDLYDFVTFDDGRLGVMIGDVSGKGVPASLFMAMSVGSFRTFALQGMDPENVLAGLNTKLAHESTSHLFVTMFYSIFDVKSGKFSYANGGHLPVLYLKPGERAQFLDVKEGAPLGLMEGSYSGGAISYGSGDVFVFYTDGVTEAMNSRSDMYGKERLQAVAEKSRDLSADKMLDAIEKDVRRFEPKSTQHDDITIMVIKVA